MTEHEKGAHAERQASAESEAAIVQTAVERFVEQHSCGEAPDLLAFVQQFPEALRPCILAQCREFLAFDGLVGHQEWEPADKPESTARTFGEFEIEEELGRGGMGIVYLARQRSLNRRVALKVMASGLTLSKLHVERFRREAASAAQLKHPSIVPVHNLVEVDGTFAIAMDYIAGRNLGDILDDLRLANGPQPTEIDGTLGIEPEKGYVAECAIFCARLASALASAHAQGVTHRDLKPRNLMIDEQRQPQLLDFGLSKSLDDASISMSGEITGTVHYMSPEQTLAKRVPIDHRIDVFALGVILYELLTLKRPFDGKNMQQVVYEICFKEPVSPQRHNPKVPRDLVTICLKALEKDPNNRYLTAAEFEADLQRFLRWEPIQAKPAGALTRLSKWIRRHRTETTAAALVLLIAGSGLGYSWYQRSATNREADRLVAEARQRDAAGLHKQALDSANLALAMRDDSETHNLKELLLARFEAAVKQEEVDIAESTRLSLASNQAIAHDRELAMLLALAAVERRDSVESRSSVLKALGFGFRKLTLTSPGGHRVGHALWSPDGESVITTDASRSSRAAILWSADGQRRHTLLGHDVMIVHAAFHPNGQLVATASHDHTVRLWNVETGVLHAIWQHDSAVDSVSFDRKGERALTFGSNWQNGAWLPPVTHVWDVTTGRRIVNFTAHSGYITAGALSPCGRFAASASRSDDFVRLWSTENEDGPELARLMGHGALVKRIEFSPDSSLIATASGDGSIRIHATSNGALLAKVHHSGAVNCLTFDSDGQRLLSGSDDMTARLWQLEHDLDRLAAHEQHVFVGHTKRILSAGFDPSGQLVVTSGSDGTLRVFDAGNSRSSTGLELMRYEVGGTHVRCAAFDANGQRVLASNGRHGVIWDFMDTRGVVTLRQPGKVPAACFDADGKHVATAGDDKNLRLWDARVGAIKWTVALDNPVTAIDIDAAGERIVAGTASGRIHVRRLRDGDALFQLPSHDADVVTVRFARNGTRILTASMGKSAVIWNANDQSEAWRIERPRRLVSADLSADGALLATVEDGENFARLWDVEAKSSRGQSPSHEGEDIMVRHVAFRPDGGAIATCGDDGKVRITPLAGGESTVIEAGESVVHCAWSHDGVRLLTSSKNDGNKVRLWDVVNNAEELRFSGHTNTVRCNAFSPDGRFVVSASTDNTACVWPTDPAGVVSRLTLRPLTDNERKLHRLDATPTTAKERLR